jgi:hypothetical protein
MEHWKRFKSYKQRGEWVELQFMAEAARRRFSVCKPWGETRAYDVGIEYGPNFLRVQVKCTSYRLSAGYLLQFMPSHRDVKEFTPEHLDIFAAYVIPESAWYLIPASLLLGERQRWSLMLSPVETPVKKACYCFECYRDAWDLLKKSRRGLARYGSRDVSTAVSLPLNLRST